MSSSPSPPPPEQPSSLVPGSDDENLPRPTRKISITVKDFNRKGSLNVAAPIIRSRMLQKEALNPELGGDGTSSVYGNGEEKGEALQERNGGAANGLVASSAPGISSEELESASAAPQTQTDETKATEEPEPTSAKVEEAVPTPPEASSGSESESQMKANGAEQSPLPEPLNKESVISATEPLSSKHSSISEGVTSAEVGQPQAQDIPAQLSSKQHELPALTENPSSSSLPHLRAAPPPPVPSADDDHEPLESPPMSPITKDKGKARAPPIPDKVPIEPTPEQTNTALQEEEKQERRSENGTGQEVAQWKLKTIIWPPRNREATTIRIITQNENGPCSLIALCNILILRGQITITPPNRASVTYDYLSSLVASHLLQMISNADSPSLDLDSALSILPKTQYGLDVNVRFGSCDGFKPLGDGDVEAGELALFRLAGIELLHGWVADVQDEDTWEAVVGRAGDYDTAVQRLAEGDEISRGLVVAGDQVGEEELEKAVEAKRLWTAEQQEKVRDAMLIRNFLDASSTQLTYPGLTQLHNHLLPGGLCALFRNSHLSVLLRKPVYEEAADERGPQLFTLATDSSFVNIDDVAWESLQDVDGGTSEYYDGDFVSTRTAARRRKERERREAEMVEQAERDRILQGAPEGADADLQLAYRLQQEEYAQEEEQRQRQEEERRGLEEAMRVNDEEQRRRRYERSSRIEQGGMPYGWHEREDVPTERSERRKSRRKDKDQHKEDGEKEKKCCIM
ncbi:hypothetical protein BT69DRAFT_1334708 [Atractiella rhizophila]|nr:hypothetical protein BT69DRAFT_1334708 [Atractiella rhizophila]